MLKMFPFRPEISKFFFIGTIKETKIKIFLLLIVLAATSCSTSKVQQSKNTNSVSIIIPKNNIILFPPLIKYESIENEKELLNYRFKGEEASIFFVNKSVEILEEKGLNILNTSSKLSNDAIFLKAYNKISNTKKDFFRSSLSSEIIENLEIFKKSYSRPYILALSIRVKIGNESTYNFYTGAITDDGSYSRLKAVLIDSEGGGNLWKNEVQLNNIPISENKDYVNAIKLLFHELKIGEL